MLHIVWTVLIKVMAAKSLLINWPPHPHVGNARFVVNRTKKQVVQCNVVQEEEA